MRANTTMLFILSRSDTAHCDMPPRWGSECVGDLTCYKHAAPLALGNRVRGASPPAELC